MPLISPFAGRRSPESGFELAVSDDPETMAELAQEWTALWRRAGGRFAASPGACQLAWERVARPAGAQLAVAIGRQAGELVLVLPMVIRQRGPLRLLGPLSPGGANYTPLLVAPAHERSSLLEQVWRQLVGWSHADVAHLPAVAQGSNLHALAARQRGARVNSSDVLAVVDLPAGETFEQYCAGLGRLSHRRPGDFRRRLARTGQLDVSVLDPGDPAIPGLVDWMLKHKRDWAQRTGKDGPWLWDRGYRDFLAAALVPATGEPIARILLIRLDGRPVAASLMGLGASRAEGLVNGFDPAYRKFSPGTITVEACIEWAFDQGLGVDFGIGDEEYKNYWSRGTFELVDHLVLPIRLRGRVALGTRQATAHAQTMLARMRPLQVERKRDTAKRPGRTKNRATFTAQISADTDDPEDTNDAARSW